MILSAYVGVQVTKNEVRHNTQDIQSLKDRQEKTLEQYSRVLTKEDFDREMQFVTAELRAINKRQADQSTRIDILLMRKH